jgi:hypothetical protein
MALKQGGGLGGRGARISASGRTSLSMKRLSDGGAGGGRPSGPELWERAAWIEWLRTNVSLFKSLAEREVAGRGGGGTRGDPRGEGAPSSLLHLCSHVRSSTSSHITHHTSHNTHTAPFFNATAN